MLINALYSKSFRQAIPAWQYYVAFLKWFVNKNCSYRLQNHRNVALGRDRLSIFYEVPRGRRLFSQHDIFILLFNRIRQMLHIRNAAYWTFVGISILCLITLTPRTQDKRQTSIVMRDKFQGFNVSRLSLPFALLHPLKPGIATINIYKSTEIGSFIKVLPYAISFLQYFNYQKLLGM